MDFLHLLIISIVISIILFAVFFIISLATNKNTPRTIDSKKNPVFTHTYTQTKGLTHEERAAKNILHKQQKLTEQYVNSSLLVDILNYICDGNYKLNKPLEIIINHHNIQSNIFGKTITYDFLSNRVPSFESIWGWPNDEPVENVLVRPMVAMAEAINMLFQNEYNIYDKAKWSSQEVRHDNTHSTYLRRYESNFVLMQLKATKHF